MSKEQEYRDNAVTTIELARRQPAGPDKNRLLALAEAWLDLAERAARSPSARLRRVMAKQDAEASRPEAS